MFEYAVFQVPNGAVSDGKGRRIPFPNHSMLIKMKPFVVVIAGSALLFLCLGNPKHQQRQQTAAKRAAIVNTFKTVRK